MNYIIVEQLYYIIQGLHGSFGTYCLNITDGMFKSIDK